MDPQTAGDVRALTNSNGTVDLIDISTAAARTPIAAVPLAGAL